MIKIDHWEDNAIMLCIHLKSDPNYIKQIQLSLSYFIDIYSIISFFILILISFCLPVSSVLNWKQVIGFIPPFLT